MDLSLLPSNEMEINAAIQAAATQGSASIARLTMLCLWRVGQRANPLTSYAGPEGLKPLPYLINVLRSRQQESEPRFVTFSALTEISRTYPKPLTTRLLQDCSEEEAERQVSAALQEALQAAHPLRRDYLINVAIRNFALRGFTRAVLQPLLERAVRHLPEPPYFGVSSELLEGLVCLREFWAAYRLVEKSPLSMWAGLYARVNLARFMLKHGFHGDAESILRDVLARRTEWVNNKPEGTKGLPEREIASGYAYLGDPTMARQIVHNERAEFRAGVEVVILLNALYNNQPLRPGPLLDLLPDIAHDLSEKHSAAVYTGILRFLLALNLVDEAVQILPLQFRVLSTVRLWGKFEYRLNDAAAALTPVANQRAKDIFPFMRDLLVAKSAPQTPKDDFWWVTHAVSGLSPLIVRWSSRSDYEALLDFLVVWSDRS